MHVREGLLCQILGSYLNRSEVSLSSLATSLNISKSHLSDIKNAKARAGIDLGLKILKSCGATLETRREWLDVSMREEIPEYEELQQLEASGSKETHLPENVGDQIGNNVELMHIALDIIEEKELGLSIAEFQDRYGKRGLQLVQLLISEGIVSSRYGRYYAEDVRLILSKRSSFSFVEGILREQREKHNAKTYEGRFEFQVDDVSEDVIKDLFNLHQEYMRGVAELIKKSRHLEKGKKVKRVFVQALSCVLRNNLALLLITVAAFVCSSSLAVANQGGLGGGSNSVRTDSIRISGYEREAHAIEEGHRIEESIVSGRYESLKKLRRDLCRDSKDMQGLEKATMRRYSVERYFSSGKELFDLIMLVEIICKNEKQDGWNSY
jgi:transcriptional regulator with XRE-family HTH domain